MSDDDTDTDDYSEENAFESILGTFRCVRTQTPQPHVALSFTSRGTDSLLKPALFMTTG